jgi:thiol-disulfide isomerase/thioredoxin
MKHLSSISFLLIILSISGLAQTKQKIQIKIDNYTDTSLLLTSYYGDKIRLIDTAYSKKGNFEFKYSEPLKGGIYMAVSNKKTKLFEFIVNNEMDQSFTTDTSAYIEHMKIKGSKENKTFFKYVLFNEAVYKQSRTLSSKLQKTGISEKQKNKYKHQLDSLNGISVDYKVNLIKSKPDLFVSKLLKSMQDPEIPENIRATKDSTYIYRYYKSHYWDKLDLSDSRFLRTPMLDKRIKEYFDRLVVFQPDSVIKEIDLVISKTKQNEEVYSYLLWHFVKEYQNPKYMGFDKVFVHLVENYFTQPAYNIENNSESVKKTLIDRSNKIKPLLLGSPAPELILIDTAGAYTSFSHLKNKYVVILFFDYECGICKKEIKYLTENQGDWKYDIGIFAVNVNGDLDKWKEFIKEKNIGSWTNVNGTRSVTQDFHDIYDIYGTPVIYLLDEKRNIIAKRMGADQIISIIERTEKSKQ